MKSLQRRSRIPVEVWTWLWRGSNEQGVVHYHHMSDRNAFIAWGFAVAPNQTEHGNLQRSDTGLNIEIRRYRPPRKVSAQSWGLLNLL